MSNLELIDAYLRDELDASAKVRFEQDMEADSELKQEFRFQQELVEGIRNARRMELKSMLDNVVVSGGSSGNAALFGKFISAAVVIGIASLGIYTLTETDSKQEYMPIAEHSEPINGLFPAEEAREQPTTTTPAVSGDVTIPEETNETAVESDAEQITKEPALISEPEINRPDAIVGFEGEGDSHDSVQAPGSVQMESKEEDNSRIEVSVDNTRKKFTFHYQFKDGKLFLYGDFSSDLYEILEFNTDGESSIFLYYEGEYYDLNNSQEKIVELKAVKDQTVITKLEAARVDG